MSFSWNSWRFPVASQGLRGNFQFGGGQTKEPRGRNGTGPAGWGGAWVSWCFEQGRKDDDV